jgi:serine/threonine-protein kinase
VKVTPDGVVKLLDFGLAKAIEDPAASTDPAGSPTITPTITLDATHAEVIIGTAPYMSPEQAQGKSADRRGDIWAFGAVLYEMLTGKRAFIGESAADTLAAVLKLEPDWTRLPAETPGAIRKLLRRCLAKDRKQRLQAIGDARIVIEEVIGGSAEETAPSGRGSETWSWWGAGGWMAAAMLAMIAGVALWGWLRPAAPEPRGVVRFSSTLPAASVPGAIALSHDGSRLAFVGGPQRQIYVRMLDQLEARPLSGAADAAFLCFSPDGQWISYVGGFGGEAQLKKIAVAGGPAQTLAGSSARAGPPFQDWGVDDNILFNSGGALLRIPAGGGEPQTLAAPDARKGERFYAAPQLLPGGRDVLLNVYAVISSSLQALNLKTGEKKILLERAGVPARYVPTGGGSAGGHIVYYAEGSLMAVPFDVGRMEVKGSPAPVVDGVQRVGLSPFGLWGVSDSGTLAYVPGASSQVASRLVWVDRKGAEQALPAPPRAYLTPRPSPDGQRIAVSIRGEDSTVDLWVYDIGRGTLDRVTSDGSSANPIWTPDGKRLMYDRPSLSTAILWVPADGSSPPSILASFEKGPISATSLSSDGKFLLGYYITAGGLWVLPLPDGSTPNPKAQSFLGSRSIEQDPQFSPDGHWVAYSGSDAGNNGIYVVPYPGAGGKIAISTAGGTKPRWGRGGRELYYRDGDKMMAVDTQSTPAFHAGAPKLLFEGRYGAGFDVTPDGKHFLMTKPPPARQAAPDQLNVVLNWFEELRRRVPGK